MGAAGNRISNLAKTILFLCFSRSATRRPSSELSHGVQSVRFCRSVACRQKCVYTFQQKAPYVRVRRMEGDAVRTNSHVLGARSEVSDGKFLL